MDASLQARFDAARATANANRRTPGPRTSTSAPASPVRSSPVRVPSSARMTTAERRAETMKAIKTAPPSRSAPSSPPRPAPRAPVTARSPAVASLSRRASATPRAPTSSPVTGSDSAQAPAPAAIASNTQEIKRLEAVIAALQQQMTGLVEAQKAQDLKTSQQMQAQDAKVALLEQHVSELTQAQATKCDCDQRLAVMADSVAKKVSSIEENLLSLEKSVSDMADTSAKVIVDLEYKLLDLEQGVSDKFLDLDDLKAQVHALEVMVGGMSSGLANVMVEVKVVAAKVTRMPTRSPPSPPTQPKIGSYPNADRVRAIMMDALNKTKGAQTRVSTSTSTSTSLESHESVTDVEASSVSKHSTASVAASQRSSVMSANATMAAPLISMDDLQGSRCAQSVTNLGASSIVNDRFSRLEAMFRAQA